MDTNKAEVIREFAKSIDEARVDMLEMIDMLVGLMTKFEETYQRQEKAVEKFLEAVNNSEDGGIKNQDVSSPSPGPGAGEGHIAYQSERMKIIEFKGHCEVKISPYFQSLISANTKLISSFIKTFTKVSYAGSDIAEEKSEFYNKIQALLNIPLKEAFYIGQGLLNEGGCKEGDAYVIY